MKILIVDDSQEKIRHVVNEILLHDGIDYEYLDFARDVLEAKQKLSETYYDLAILDIAIPLRSDNGPDSKGGLLLIDELKHRRRYKLPGHIIGLTSHRELLEATEKHLSKEAWSTIIYDRAKSDWGESIRGKIDYILSSTASIQSSNKVHLTDVFLLTALKDPELSAILNLPLDWQKSNDYGTGLIVYSGKLEVEGTYFDIKAACLPTMGPVSSSTFTAYVIGAFHPKYIIMPGIMAGNKEQVNLGDIIIANPTWDWGSGKQTVDTEGNIKFENSPFQEAVNHDLISITRHLLDDRILLNKIYDGWAGPKPDSALKAHEGPVATGSSVIANNGFFESLVKQHRKLLGIEMEAYPFMYASGRSPKPRPSCITIKSVCDYADETKNNNYQAYAAYTSAEFCFALIKQIGIVEQAIG